MVNRDIVLVIIFILMVVGNWDVLVGHFQIPVLRLFSSYIANGK